MGEQDINGTTALIKLLSSSRISNADFSTQAFQQLFEKEYQILDY